MSVLLTVNGAVQGALPQPHVYPVAFLYLLARPQHRAVRRLGHGIAPAQHLQRTEGVQRRRQRSKPLLPPAQLPVGPIRCCTLPNCIRRSSTKAMGSVSTRLDASVFHWASAFSNVFSAPCAMARPALSSRFHSSA